MQAKKMRSPKHLKADATPGEATKKIAELSADHSVCDAGRDELSRRCSDMKTKKRARCQQELGADAAPASPPQRDRNRPAGSGSKEGSQPSSCCILLTHCPLYLYRDRRHSSTAGLLNLDEHKYMLAGDPSASSHAEAFSFPFLDKIQAQLRQLHQPVQRCRNGHGDAVGAQTRGMAAASEAARRNALALAEDRRLLLEASMRSDVVHQCLLNILDSIVVSQLRTGVPHFASGADARETAKVWKRQAGAKESPTPAHSSGVHLDILLHTLDGKLLRVSPSFRVPRNFKVFKKVASMALSSPTGKLCATPTARTEKCRRHGWGSAEKDRAQADDEDSAEEDRQAGSLPEEEETLIEVLQPPFWRHLPEQFRPICLSGSRHAPKVALRLMMTELRQQKTDLVFVISACPFLDAVAIPRCLLRQPTLSGEPLRGERNGQRLASGQGPATLKNEGEDMQCNDTFDGSPVVISISSFPMSAAVRCDRLIHEMTPFLPSVQPC